MRRRRHCVLLLFSSVFNLSVSGMCCFLSFLTFSFLPCEVSSSQFFQFSTCHCQAFFVCFLRLSRSYLVRCRHRRFPRSQLVTIRPFILLLFLFCLLTFSFLPREASSLNFLVLNSSLSGVCRCCCFLRLSRSYLFFIADFLALN